MYVSINQYVCTVCMYVCMYVCMFTFFPHLNAASKASLACLPLPDPYPAVPLKLPITTNARCVRILKCYKGIHTYIHTYINT